MMKILAVANKFLLLAQLVEFCMVTQRASVCVRACISVCMCVYMCVCLYLYIFPIN